MAGALVIGLEEWLCQKNPGTMTKDDNVLFPRQEIFKAETDASRAELHTLVSQSLMQPRSTFTGLVFCKV